MSVFVFSSAPSLTKLSTHQRLRFVVLASSVISFSPAPLCKSIKYVHFHSMQPSNKRITVNYYGIQHVCRSLLQSLRSKTEDESTIYSQKFKHKLCAVLPPVNGYRSEPPQSFNSSMLCPWLSSRACSSCLLASVCPSTPVCKYS